MFSLIFILNLLTELEFFKEIEVSSYFPIYLSFLNTPPYIFEMFPFIFLIATQLFFNNLFNNNQFNIFKYSGLKNIKIINIINITTFFIGIILITLFYSFSANLKSYYIELKSNYTSDNKYLAVITNNGLWIKDINDQNILIINAAKIDQNFLIDSYISEFDKNFNIIRNIKSKKIDVSKKEWLIFDAEIFSQSFREKRETIKIKTNFNYQIIQSLFSNLSSLSFLELLEMRKKYKKLNYSLIEVDLQLLKLFFLPFYLVLMTLISSIIMMNTKKLRNKYVKIVIGLFSSVVIYYISNFFYVLGTTERINLVVSIIIPLLFLLLINTYFIRDINAK
jgi:lipopolysaccharide export system permease protein